MRAHVVRFLANDVGQDLIEYGLLIGMIAATIVLVASAISTKIQEYYNTLNENLGST